MIIIILSAHLEDCTIAVYIPVKASREHRIPTKRLFDYTVYYAVSVVEEVERKENHCFIR